MNKYFNILFHLEIQFKNTYEISIPIKVIRFENKKLIFIFCPVVVVR